MSNASPPKASVKTLKHLLKLADDHELQLLEFNGVKVLRGGPASAKRQAAEAKARKAIPAAFDLPESVEEMDKGIYDRVKGHLS